MSFISKLIPGKKVLIIDVGTYKVKVALCEYKNAQVQILSYAEKKQEKSDIIGSEIANIQWVSNTIEQAINKAIKDQNCNPKDIIINIPTSSLISSGRSIAYTREKHEENIDMNELDYIIGKVESYALENAKKEITKKTGFSDVDMKLITSSITDINIDGFKVSNPIGFTGKNISISALNIFIPSSRYNIIQTIANYLNKNILSIIPLEFSLPKILEISDHSYDDVVFIDIGNTKTSIIVQKKWVILGFDRIDIGMNDLIKNIQNSSNETTMEIIKKLDHTGAYVAEKEQFLNVWKEGFMICVKDILKTSLIPDKILLSGGGDNMFLRQALQEISLPSYGLHAIKPFSFIRVDIEKEIPFPNTKHICDKTNFGIVSMVMAAKEIVNYKNSPVVSILKNFLEKNEF